MDREVTIQTEFIKLDNLMKLAGAVHTGGEAKQLIQGEQVSVNGILCVMRGKKMRDGDFFQYRGETCTLHVKE